MDYSQFLYMKEELSLIAVILILFVVDLFTCPDQKGATPKVNVRSLTLPAVILMTLHTVINLFPGTPAEAFGGMYQYTPMQTIIKAVLNVGTIIVLLMAHEWLKREDTHIKQGEFYVLTLSTLLGMYFMISAGHFLMFFIGLEMASIPMAALVAFDKYRHHSAEAGAKYILTALFSSALLLFGLSMIYGTSGTLYFNDLPGHITGNMLQIMAFVFFFAGMGFKICIGSFPPLDSRRIRRSAYSRNLLFKCDFQRIGSFRADDHPDESVRTDGGTMAGSIVLGNHCFHHHCQPLCYPPTEPETFHGILRYLPSGIHHAGCHRRQ